MTGTTIYKNRTVARKDNTIWYGDNSKPYVVMMQLGSAEAMGGVSVAGTVRCYLMRTDTTDPKERIKKNTVCTSLYGAMELADAWLKGYGI